MKLLKRAALFILVTAIMSGLFPTLVSAETSFLPKPDGKAISSSGKPATILIAQENTPVMASGDSVEPQSDEQPIFDEELFRSAVLSAEPGKEIGFNGFKIVLTQDFCIPEGVTVTIDNGGTLIVSEGVTLDVAGELNVYNESLLKVEEGASLNVSNPDWAAIDIWYGSLDVTGADISGVPQNAIVVLLGFGQPVLGISDDLLYGVYFVQSTQDVLYALDMAPDYGYFQINPYESFVLTESITIPEGMLWNMYYSDNCVVTIPEGVTFTNNGEVWIQSGNQMIVEKGATFANNNYIWVEEEAVAIIEGYYEGFGTIDASGSNIIMSQDALEHVMAGLDEGYYWIHRATTRLERDLSIDSSFGVVNGGTMIVPDGITLTISGKLYIGENGHILVEEGGTLVVNGAIDGSSSYIMKKGSLQIEAGGNLILNDNLYCYQGSTLAAYGGYTIENGCFVGIFYEHDALCEIIGVAKEHQMPIISVADEETLRKAIEYTKSAGFAKNMISVEANVELRQDLIIPENCRIQPMYEMTLTIAEGVTLTNNGSLECWQMRYIQNYGTIDNNGEFIARGEVYNQGLINLNAGSTLEVGGTVINNAVVMLHPEGIYEIYEGGSWTGNAPVLMGGEPAHEYQLGDVNHDGKINAKDATLILQKSVGVLKENAKFCETCAEVSGDGKLNAKDSTLILQYSVGLRDSFPAGA